MRPDDPRLVAADWLREAIDFLQAKGIESAGTDARLLLARVGGVSRLDVIRDPGTRLEPEAYSRLATALSQRALGKPVSRILGEREFYGRPFRVNPDTLDPRPETETLVEAALELIAREQLQDRPIRILDIGTGTGCIAITLLAELPFATAVATDLNARALAVAAENAARHGVAHRLQLVEADLFDGVQGPFDLAVSNPPYIATAQIPDLPPEVRLFDPLLALDGGSDGLTPYRRILHEIHRVVPNGWTILEIGAGQRAEVQAIAHAAGFGPEPAVNRVWRDLGGHERIVAFQTRR